MPCRQRESIKLNSWFTGIKIYPNKKSLPAEDQKCVFSNDPLDVYTCEHTEAQRGKRIGSGSRVLRITDVDMAWKMYVEGGSGGEVM